MSEKHHTLNLDQIAAAAAGTFVSIASAGVLNHHLEVFGVTFDGELRHRWYDAGWSSWARMPIRQGTKAAHVGAAAHGQWVDLFVISVKGQLLHRWWSRQEGWSDWSDWGSDFTGPITVASLSESHNEVWVRRRGTLLHKWLLNDIWSNWHEFT